MITKGADPADAYRAVVADIQNGDLADFTSHLAPGFFGLDLDVADCNQGETAPDRVLSCLSSAIASQELALPPAPGRTSDARSILSKQYSGSELEQQLADALARTSSTTGAKLTESDLVAVSAPHAFPDGTGLDLDFVRIDAKWLLYGIESP